MRPKVLIIHDNLKKKIFFIRNIFKDEKINNYKKKYFEIKKELTDLIMLAQTKKREASFNNQINKNLIKSNTTKERFINMVKKAKKNIKIGDIFQEVLRQRLKLS